jgi:dipeptidyl aminopeptidase/acylaminoacyl peptidase
MSNLLHRSSFALTALALATSSLAQIKMTDYRRLVLPSAVQVSPDGSKVMFVATHQDFANDVYATTLDVVEIKGVSVRMLTKGDHKVSSPRWSPGGDRIAFLMEDASHNAQLCVMPARGGAIKQLTHIDTGVDQISWSPKGDRIAYVAQDVYTAPADHNDLFDIHDDGFLTASRPMPCHIWLVPVTGGPAHRLTHGPWSVLETPPPFQGTMSDPSWSSDGRQITFCRQPNADDSDSDRTSVAVADVATGAVTAPTSHNAYEYQPSFSPTDNKIAYTYPHGPTPLSCMDVCVVGEAAPSGGSDHDFTDYKWLPDGRIVMIASEGLERGLWVGGAGHETKRLDLGEVYPSEVNAGRTGAIAFVASNVTTPPEVYFMSSPTSKPKKLTNFNKDLAQRKYARVTEIKWTSPDGEKCDGVLTYPFRFEQGKKYPLAIFIHGGPEAAALRLYIGFEGDYLRQSLAGDGYFVFEPNYRGSDNLGNAHEHAIYRNPTRGPASDILSGVDAVEALGGVDESRIAISGHSYGGTMTSWIIGHDHRWKCATVGDGMVDWTHEYSFSADGNLAWTRDSLGGNPWDPGAADLYKEGSAINTASDITTPTLILSGTADETVPITESYSLYHALKDHNVPVRFIGIPGAHHLPGDPVRLEAFYGAFEQWTRHYNP